MVVKQGIIKDAGSEYITILTPRPAISTDFLLQSNVEVRFNDGRTITNSQRAKIYCILKDISFYSGYTEHYHDKPVIVKELMKERYIIKTEADYFSLSDVDITTANDFMQFLIEFCIEKDFPLNDTPVPPDIRRHVYFCMLNKTCCVCGKKNAVVLHHYDRVGIGRNRKEISHLGMRAQPLCGIHHKEVHEQGQQTFDDMYFLTSIEVNADIARVYRLRI